MKNKKLNVLICGATGFIVKIWLITLAKKNLKFLQLIIIKVSLEK